MANMAGVKKVARFAIEQKLPLVLWGEAGVGKTEAVEQLAAELGYNLVTLHLATQDVADLIGVPLPIEGKTVYAKPSWFVDKDTDPSVANPDKPTIYFLDEFNRGSRPVLACMLPFLLSGKIHEHRIRKDMGDTVLAACNFADDDYEVTELADKALRDRCGHIICRPDATEFFDFAKGKLDDTSWEMLKGNHKMIDIPLKELDFKIEASRRKIMQVMPHFKKANMAYMKSAGLQILQSFLGEDFATVWFKHFKKRDQGISVEEILEMNPETKKKIERFTTGDVRVDILEITNQKIVKYLKKHKKRIPAKKAENLFLYVFMLPPDIMRIYIEELEKEVEKINGQEFGEYFWDLANKHNKLDAIEVLVQSYKE